MPLVVPQEDSKIGAKGAMKLLDFGVHVLISLAQRLDDQAMTYLVPRGRWFEETYPMQPMLIHCQPNFDSESRVPTYESR